MANCNKCIFPLLKGCPVSGSLNNAACLYLYKNREECTKEKCETCEYLNYCKEKGINLNHDNKRI